MRAAFSEIVQKKMGENPIFKKTLIRVFTLSLSLGLIFSMISYSFFHHQLMKTESIIILYFVVIVMISVFIGGFCGLLVFGNILTHIKRIIYELSSNNPRWEWLEREYMESDIHSAYMSIKKLHLSVSYQSKLLCVGQIAAQVAHDIRSPLVALDTVIKDISNIPEEQRNIIRNATGRIYSIANNLLDQYKNNTTNFSESSFKKKPELIAELVSDSVSEKKYQCKHIPVDFVIQMDEGSYGQFFDVCKSTFKRAISNLLNNAVEALVGKDKGIINISVSTQENTITLIIQDNGCGIESEQLQKIMIGDITTQKDLGHGLGLSYAIKVVEEELNGQFSIQSKINEGTKIEINLKGSNAPVWFVSELTVLDKMKVIVLDDEETIHQTWRKRFEKTGATIDFIEFYNPNDLISAFQEQKLSERVLFLIDFELLGYSTTGLEVIKKLNIIENVYLVTGCYDNQTIQEQCNQLGIGIIPKTFASNIPIISLNTELKPDLIIIDDNQSLIDAWIFHGESVGKQVKAFNNISSLKSVINRYEKNIPIYIDSDLNDKISGQELAKSLYEQGFINLYLSTGYSSDYFEPMPWIKGILGKEPPF